MRILVNSFHGKLDSVTQRRRGSRKRGRGAIESEAIQQRSTSLYRLMLRRNGLKIVDAPGVALNVKDGDVPRNDKMYIIETLIEAPEGLV